jgi:hypothetical protein
MLNPVTDTEKKTSEKPTKNGLAMGLFGVQLTHFVVGVCEHIISLPPSQQH